MALEAQIDLPIKEMFASGHNLPDALFAAKSRVMIRDAFAFNRASVLRNRGIAAHKEEWHHIALEAEIFVWPSHPRAGYLAGSTKLNAYMEDAIA